MIHDPVFQSLVDAGRRRQRGPGWATMERWIRATPRALLPAMARICALQARVNRQWAIARFFDALTEYADARAGGRS
jgi:hypothetical protein